jgi:hypothetical protein
MNKKWGDKHRAGRVCGKMGEITPISADFGALDLVPRGVIM